MDRTAYSSPSDAAKHFVALLAGLHEPVKQLGPKEQHRAAQILHEVPQDFHKVVGAKEENERKHLLAHVRDLLTELERILTGQHMLFASHLSARVANRFLTALHENITKVFKDLFAICDSIEELIESDTMRQLGIKPAPQGPKTRVKAPKTYKQAQDEILNALHHAGWAVVAGLKIPHATSSDGTFRFWFKPQAIYYSENYTGRGGWSLGGARSMWAKDYRFEDPVKFAKALEAYAARAQKRDRAQAGGI